MCRFIHVRSDSFPILPGEEDELLNDGTYGKALAVYLRENLNNLGYDAPFVCCEDWGWWVELKSAPFTFGVCLYSQPESTPPRDFVCSAGITGRRKWSWKSWWFIDTFRYVEKLEADLLRLFESDPRIEFVGVTDEFPF